MPFVFLERVKADFMQRYGPSIKNEGPHPLADDEDDDLFEDRFSIAYNLDREFGCVYVFSSLKLNIFFFKDSITLLSNLLYFSLAGQGLRSTCNTA